MSTELIVNASLPETRIALMENGEIQELLIERASGKGIVGNIYKGRVTRVLPGMQAAFVDIGLEKAAFLYVDDVFVHSEIWESEEEEGANPAAKVIAAINEAEGGEISTATAGEAETAATPEGETPASTNEEVTAPIETSQAGTEGESTAEGSVEWEEVEGMDEDEEDEEDEEPVEMGTDPNDPNGPGDQGPPPETVAPSDSDKGNSASASDAPAGEPRAAGPGGQGGRDSQGGGHRRRHRRGRRGGRYRRRDGEERPDRKATQGQGQDQQNNEDMPDSFQEQVLDKGNLDSDRSAMGGSGMESGGDSSRPGEIMHDNPTAVDRVSTVNKGHFKQQRSRDRRIRPKTSGRSFRAQVNIQDLLKEGQEVLVQVAKDPIATKGARLTCHISLPGRHLVCMPTIDHVGVSRRIERDDERRRLRDFVERNRPRKLGFIVRTASGKQHERRITQDIEYLTRLWTEIREKAAAVTAPALVYEDLNAVLRAIRDWVTEDIDKIMVDSRYHYNDIQKFVSHFMPPLKQKVDLYHGDIPIFDAYGISTELSRSLERKVWLKSGGYIVIDQAEALVAIDVNTGRYVGKKNLEDTILKTNLEAVQEIAYQLRLRNCGGIIILDLIDMEKEENKQRVYRALEDALKKDRARPTILKISELGLVEMTRKRTRDTIIRTLCESCSHCEGKGFIKSKQTVAYEVLREIEREGIERDVGKVLVQAHPDVIDILAIDERETLDQLERRYRKQIYLQAVTDFHPEQFEVAGDKKERKEAGGYEPREQRGGRQNRGPRHHSSQPKPRREETEESSHPTGSPIRPVGDDESPQQQDPMAAAPQAGDETATTGGGDSVNSGDLGQGPAPGADPTDGFYDEEDRLAFLRAQAAQDAALARMTAGNAAGGTRMSAGGGKGLAGKAGPGGSRGGHGGDKRGGDRDNRGGRRGKRGRRGGKFHKDRGGFRPQQAGGGGGIITPVARNTESPGADQTSSAPTSSDGPTNGGGERSNPPTTPPVSQ